MCKGKKCTERHCALRQEKDKRSGFKTTFGTHLSDYKFNQKDIPFWWDKLEELIISKQQQQNTLQNKPGIKQEIFS